MSVTYLISLKVVLFASFQMLKATVMHHVQLHFPSMERCEIDVFLFTLSEKVRWPSISQGYKMAPGIKD